VIRLTRATAVTAAKAVAAKAVVPAAAIADQAEPEAGAGLPEAAANSAWIVLVVDAVANVRLVGTRHALAPDGC
jgi:hypothetical protein